jgi:hypothetical protein
LRLRKDFPPGCLPRLTPDPGSLTGVHVRTRFHQRLLVLLQIFEIKPQRAAWVNLHCVNARGDSPGVRIGGQQHFFRLRVKLHDFRPEVCADFLGYPLVNKKQRNRKNCVV